MPQFQLHLDEFFVSIYNKIKFSYNCLEGILHQLVLILLFLNTANCFRTDVSVQQLAMNSYK
jgi:hypothetical protein